LPEPALKNGAGKRNGTGKSPAVATGKTGPVTKRTSTGSHRAVRRGGGGKVALFVVALFLASGVGAGLAFKDELLSASKPVISTTRPPVGPLRPTDPVRPADPVKPTDPVKPADPVKPIDVPVPPTADNGMAERAIAEGKRMLAQLNYEGARGAFGRLETMKCSPELTKEATLLARKADSFQRLTREIKVRSDAGKVISIVTLADGRTLRGVVTRNADGSYKVVTGTRGAGEMTMTLLAGDVREVQAIDPAAERADLVRALDARMGRVSAANAPVEYFDAAVFAIENGLAEESLGALEKAWGAAEKAQKDLVLLVAEDKAGRDFAQANWSDSIGQELWARKYCERIRANEMYRNTSFYEAAEKLLAMMDARKGIVGGYKRTYVIEDKGPQQDPTKTTRPEPVKTTGPEPIATVPPPPPKVTVENITSKGDLSAANRAFEEGMKFFIQGRPGNANSNYNLAQAKKNFREALDIYEQAAKRDPGNSSLQSRIQDCNMKIYACSKMMTL
jgi:tetratricopeptide (TPR) repeat protein